MTWRLSDPSTMSFEMDGRDPQSFHVTELGTDIHLLRDGFPVFTGRVGVTSHTLDADGHKRTVNVADTRALLARRLTLVNRDWTGGIDAAVAFRDLAQDVQAPVGGDLGVEVPTFPSLGITVNRASEIGQPVLKEMQETAGVSGGASVASPLFDWDITPGWLNRTFQLWSRRGSDKGVFLDYTFSAQNPRASNVANLSRSFDPSTYANAVYITGGVKKVKQLQQVQSESQPNPVGVETTPAVATSGTGSVTRGTRPTTSASSAEKERLTQLAIQASAASRAASDKADTYYSESNRFAQAQQAAQAAGNSSVAASYGKQKQQADAQRNAAFEQATKFANQATAYYAQAAQIPGDSTTSTGGTRTEVTPTTQVSDATSIEYEEVEVEFPTTPVTRQDGSLAWSVGLWATAEGRTDIVEQSELEAAAIARLAELQQVTPTYQVTLFPGFWQGPDHIWIGDTVTVHIDSGSLFETVRLRVTELRVGLSDDGQETVDLTVGSPASQYLNTLMEATRRISSLERRR